MVTQWMVRNTFRLTFLITFTTSIFLFSGCSVISKTVPIERRIPLVSGGIQQGKQVVRRVTITYSYRLDQKTSDLSGLLEIEGNAQWKHGTAYFMNLWINFLDTKGKILKKQSLLQSFRVDRGRFKTKLVVPAGTAGISYGANATDYGSFVPARVQ